MGRASTNRWSGTADQITYATRAWTPNGQLGTVKDANNNLSDLVYDGFDRLHELRFPSPALGAGTANPADFERYTYDNNGNRTRLRLRSGEENKHSAMESMRMANRRRRATRRTRSKT